MKVFIVGGTGFIGYYTTLEQLKRGNQVSTISLPDIKIGDWFPKEVGVEHGDVFKMSDKELKKLFVGYDAMVYAVGPDDRYLPDGSATEFFHNALVEKCGRVVAAAREAGVKKCVVCGSYFSYFDKVYPKRKLAEHHPYISARRAQEKRVISEGKGKMDVMVLELPYIFGTMPERVPLWKDILVKMLYTSEKISYPKGGTAMVSVQTVAEAASGALENGAHGECYPIGDENKTWVELLTVMLKAMGMEHKKIVTIPTFLMTMYGKNLLKEEAAKGKEPGLNYAHLFKDIQEKNSFIDATDVKKKLGYAGGDVDDSIAITVKRCVEELQKDGVQPVM